MTRRPSTEADRGVGSDSDGVGDPVILAKKGGLASLRREAV
jgi:hypothetical protein